MPKSFQISIILQGLLLLSMKEGLFLLERTVKRRKLSLKGKE
jgi:hypothetical protein